MVVRRLAVVPDIMTARTWATSVPKTITAKTGMDAANVALSEAKSIRLFVASRFKGTIPPPPWPMHEGMQLARKELRIVRDGMKAIAKRKPDAKLKPVVRALLIRKGDAMYRETNVLLKKWRGLPRPDDPGSLLPNIFESMPWWVWAGAAYLFFKR